MEENTNVMENTDEVLTGDVVDSVVELGDTNGALNKGAVMIGFGIAGALAGAYFGLRKPVAKLIDKIKAKHKEHQLKKLEACVPTTDETNEESEEE